MRGPCAGGLSWCGTFVITCAGLGARIGAQPIGAGLTIRGPTLIPVLGWGPTLWLGQIIIFKSVAVLCPYFVGAINGVLALSLVRGPYFG